MKKVAHAQVSSKNTITIPKKVRKELDELKEGDFISFYKYDNQIIIEKEVLKIVPRSKKEKR